MNPMVRDRILTWFEAGLAAVEPAAVTSRALQEIEIGTGKLVVLAIGKAAVAMATAANDVFGDRISAGLLVTKQGQLSAAVERFDALEAAHPIPDERSLHAGERVLELVSGLAESDTVIALISGGGSALLEHPIDGISLMDMQITTELLMYAGAGIHDLNTVRTSLSAIKGGGLRRAIGEARCITLMLSDVLGNDYSVIASGPTMQTPTHKHSAWQVLVDFHLQDQVPASVRHALTGDAPHPPLMDISRDTKRIIADNRTMIQAVVKAARADQLTTEVGWENQSGDAATLARDLWQTCRVADSRVQVLIGGGEVTSTVVGNGKGGRNTETALRAAMLLHESGDSGWTIASLASDGDDGNSGAAGAIVDASTIHDTDAAKAALANSDSAGYLEQRSALVVTGHTGTNVNDIYIAVRTSAITGESN